MTFRADTGAVNMPSIPPRSIETDHLLLRPTRGSDAARAFEIQTDWEVTRMLSLASFPPDRQELGRWFADREREWLAGEAYRFAVEHEGRMIGMADIDGIAAREGTLGYWLDRAAWGRGHAFEAAHAVTCFALEGVGLTRLEAGHADDNPASGRILIKLGFTLTGTAQGFSRSRGEYIERRRYELTSFGD
jgi:ribosomal-protein-alanine N-acetyltransferase